MNYNKLTQSTTPAIMFQKCSGVGPEWKVSPFGPMDPDRDATWCHSRKDAEEEAFTVVVGAMEEVRLMEQELIQLRKYLTSDKFREDPTVQTGDILHRLDQIQSRVSDDAAQKASEAWTKVAGPTVAAV